jgi:hypothetical protein
VSWGCARPGRARPLRLPRRESRDRRVPGPVLGRRTGACRQRSTPGRPRSYPTDRRPEHPT